MLFSFQWEYGIICLQAKNLTNFLRGGKMTLFKKNKNQASSAKKEKKKIVKISKKAIQHSSLGEFTQGDKKHPPRLKSGGHGEENIRELKNRGIDYKITKEYPNGVRVGNVSNHQDKRKRELNKQMWFPKNWKRSTIKKAGEKTIQEERNKKEDGKISIGTYRKVKVGVIWTNGKVATIFPYHKQSGGKR